VEPKLAEAGLADIVGCDSVICFIDGVNDRLFYRGYDALILTPPIFVTAIVKKVPGKKTYQLPQTKAC